MQGKRSRTRGIVLAIIALVGWGLVGGVFDEAMAQPPKPESAVRPAMISNTLAFGIFIDVTVRADSFPGSCPSATQGWPDPDCRW